MPECPYHTDVLKAVATVQNDIVNIKEDIDDSGRYIENIFDRLRGIETKVATMEAVKNNPGNKAKWHGKIAYYTLILGVITSLITSGTLLIIHFTS